jgi:2'-5' RNA ligase
MPVHGVAVTVPQPWGTQLQEARAAFGDPMAAAIPPHVTLLPPTEAGPQEMAVVDAHLRAVTAASRPFEVVLAGTGTFRPVSPVVFVQVSQGIAACEVLERAIRSGPLRRDLQFPYHPHVTVAHHLDDAALDTAFDSLAGFRCEFAVSAVELYRHDDDGVWRAARSYPLGRPSSVAVDDTRGTGE